MSEEINIYVKIIKKKNKKLRFRTLFMSRDQIYLFVFFRNYKNRNCASEAKK